MGGFFEYFVIHPGIILGRVDLRVDRGSLEMTWPSGMLQELIILSDTPPPAADDTEVVPP